MQVIHLTVAEPSSPVRAGAPATTQSVGGSAMTNILGLPRSLMWVALAKLQRLVFVRWIVSEINVSPAHMLTVHVLTIDMMMCVT